MLADINYNEVDVEEFTIDLPDFKMSYKYMYIHDDELEGVLKNAVNGMEEKCRGS